LKNFTKLRFDVTENFEKFYKILGTKQTLSLRRCICSMMMKIPAGPGMEESNCQRQERSLHSGPRIYRSLSPCSHHLLTRSLASSWSRSIYHWPELGRYIWGVKTWEASLGQGCQAITVFRAPLCIGRSECAAATTDLPAPLDMATVRP
jgi:hypothetical protein